MQLALHTDYALRSLIYLSGKPGRATVADIAGYFQISRDHVAKVIQRLARLGFVRSIRGQGGGVEMARDADDISVGEVIHAMEGKTHLLDCVASEGVCVIERNCKLKGVLARAESLQMEFLYSVKLSDVIQPGGQLVELQPLQS